MTFTVTSSSPLAGVFLPRLDFFFFFFVVVVFFFFFRVVVVVVKREKERRFKVKRRTFLCNCFPPRTRGKRRTAALAMRREDEAKDARGRDFCERLWTTLLSRRRTGF